MLKRIILAAAVVMSLLFGVGISPAAANPAGNIAQPNTSFSCSSLGYTLIQGVIDVHYNHGADHSDDPYGTYWTITYIGGYATGNINLDTDIRYVGSSTWHYAGAQYSHNLGADGDLFDYDIARTPSGGYARWAMAIERTDGTWVGCQVAPHGWNTGEQYGAP